MSKDKLTRLGAPLLLLASSLALLLHSGSLTAQPVETRPLENLGIPNWPGHDYAPHISPDGRYLIFQSDRPGAHEEHNLWFSVNRNHNDRLGATEWSMPLPLRFPLVGAASDTMRLVRPPDSLELPPGAFSVNSDDFVGMPSIVWRDGQPIEIYFTSRRGVRPGMERLNIYFSRYRDGRWSEPQHVNIINSHFNDRSPMITADGRSLYFASDRPGGFGGFDIWMSQRDLRTGRWSDPVNLGPRVNSRYNEITPTLSQHGGALYFSSDRPGGFGKYDLYIARWDGYRWSSAENMGEPFNSSRDDESISFTGDGLWAYFASDRRHAQARGGFDLYRVTLPPRLRESVEILFTGLILDASSRLPLGVEATIHIHYEESTIVTNARVIRRVENDTATNFSVRLRSGRDYRAVVSAPGFHPQELVLDYRGDIESDRIDRRIILLQPIRPERRDQESELRLYPGRVVDAVTGLALPGARLLFRPSDGDSEEISLDREGRFVVALKPRERVEFEGSAPGYESRRLDVVEDPALEQIVIRLTPISGAGPCPGDDPACIDNLRIFFDLNSSSIDAEGSEKLEAIVRILRANPRLSIEIQGHTDRSYRGPDDASFRYNQQLSEQRARNVRGALIELGIPPERLIIRGFSFLRPLEEDQIESRQNRRVEFRRVE